MAALGVLPLAGSLKQSTALPQRNRLQNRPHIQPPRCNCVVAAAATAGPSAQQKIRVKLSSYHSELLTESVDLIRTATESTGPSLLSCVQLWAGLQQRSWCIGSTRWQRRSTCVGGRGTRCCLPARPARECNQHSDS